MLGWLHRPDIIRDVFGGGEIDRRLVERFKQEGAAYRLLREGAAWLCQRKAIPAAGLERLGRSRARTVARGRAGRKDFKDLRASLDPLRLPAKLTDAASPVRDPRWVDERVDDRIPRELIVRAVRFAKVPHATYGEVRRREGRMHCVADLI